jgi:hypothetical protein
LAARGAAVRAVTRIFPLVAALAAALVLGSNTGAQLPTSGVGISLSFGAKPTLAVETISSGSGISTLAVASGSTGTPVPPARVVVDLAPGYQVTPPAPGAVVGLGIVSASSGSLLGGGAFAALFAELVADDPAKYANDPSAQACAAGPYTAVWRFSSSAFGLSYTLPIFVGHPAGDAQRVELRFCPAPLTGADGKPVTTAPVPLDGAMLLLSPIAAPRGRGEFTSSAYITDETLSGAPDPATTGEARFVDPVPHALSARGRYDAKTRAAVLTGRVTELGKPQAGAAVEYFGDTSFAPPKHVRTSAKGTFSTRVRIPSTTTFFLDVPDATVACRGSSSAPRGCLSLTVAGTNTRLVRVAVPRHG